MLQGQIFASNPWVGALVSLKFQGRTPTIVLNGMDYYLAMLLLKHTHPPDRGTSYWFRWWRVSQGNSLFNAGRRPVEPLVRKQ